jgi:hypothetical protein
MEESEMKARDHGRPEIDDFTVFREGDLFKPFNKVIGYLIISEIGYIVFLDDDTNVHWSCNKDYRNMMPEGCGSILNRVGVLESESVLLVSKKKRILVRRLLGESIARLFEASKDTQGSDRILDKAEKLMDDIGNTSSRMWYLGGSSVMGLAALLLMIVAVYYKACLEKFFGPNSFELIMGSLCGAPGALLFVAYRADSIIMNYAMGFRIHFFEGMLRGFVAVIGALIVALGVKADVIGGFATKTIDPLLLTMLMCLASGASERLLPSLISKLDKSVDEK